MKTTAERLVEDRLLVGHANLWYLDAIQTIRAHGAEVTARGRTTHEILHVRTTLPKPRKRVLTVPYRRANPFFQLAECAWILAGRNDAAWILQYNKQLAQFLDYPGPGMTVGEFLSLEGQRPDLHDTGQKSLYFHGAYGNRLRHATDGDSEERDQLQDVLLQLRQDPGSRRAVATLHDPLIDHPEWETLDRPCNLALSYQLREGALWAATFNRSNDLNLGLAFTNIVQFTVIQEFLAAALHVDVGTYTHFSSSLHVYDDDPVVARLERKVIDEPFDVYTHVSPTEWEMRPWPSDMFGFDVAEYITADLDDPRLDALVCPFWSSMVWVLRTWRALQCPDVTDRDRLRAAFFGLSSVQMTDWKIACWEYLHRWAVNRGLRNRFIEWLPTCADPVRDFILHDVEPA